MSKYRSIRVKADGYSFDSQAEHARYCELKLLSRAGEIEELRVHPSWPLFVQGFLITTYEADFSYRNMKPQDVPYPKLLVVEDVKGFATPDYKIKRELFKALHPWADFRELNTDKSATRKAWTKFAVGRGVQTAAGGGK